MKLWTPPNHRPPHATLPEGDVRLPDGSWLRRLAAVKMPNNPDILTAAAWRGPRGLRVLASIDQTERFGDLLHVSLSYADRDPSWDDIKAVKAAFFGPDRDCMLPLPRQADYINLHEHTFHIVEMPEHWGMQ